MFTWFWLGLAVAGVFTIVLAGALLAKYVSWFWKQF